MVRPLRPTVAIYKKTANGAHRQLIPKESMADHYQILTRPAEHTFEQKRSRFLAFVWHCETKSEGMAQFEIIKTDYPDARHHCWAYIIGDPERAQTAGFNDDGEPSGTAGKPMLNVLMQRRVGDVFAVVVRYFGGVKLGAGGLSRAYGAAVSGALDSVELAIVEPHRKLQIHVDFPHEQRVRTILAAHGITEVDVAYHEEVQIQCNCKLVLVDEIVKAVLEQTAGQARCS